MSTTVITELKDAILQLTINRPECKNAINKATYAALADHIESASTDDDVRVLILVGSNGCFSSGNDLEDFKNTSAEPEDENPAVWRFMRALAACPKPVVAAVEGVAVGIGATILLHCDLVYAHADTRFCLPFVNLGLTPEY